MQEVQKKVDTNWTMSSERAFLENLLCARFNFFLVIFAAIIAGMIATENLLQVQLVLVSGTALCLLITLTLCRAQFKLDIIFKELRECQPDHPAIKLDNLAGGWSMRRLIGYGIPGLCCLFLCIMTYCAFFRDLSEWLKD